MSGTPQPIPSPLDAKPFSLAEAADAGITRSRLRAKDLESPFAGVRAGAAPANALELASAYLPKLAPGEFFSHSTAALLHGMWLPMRLQEELALHVSVVKPQRAPRDRRVRGHHLVERPGLVWTMQDASLADPWETWAQLARLLTVDELVVAGESLLAKGRSDVGVMLERLGAVAADEHRPFNRRLALAAPHLRIGVRSAAETRFRLFLVRNGLPEPRIDLDIVDAAGRFVAEGDLVYPEEHVLIEYEGDGHREKRQFRKDISRIERVQDLGWRVIRVTADDERDRPDETLGRVRRAVRNGGSPPDPQAGRR